MTIFFAADVFPISNDGIKKGGPKFFQQVTNSFLIGPKDQKNHLLALFF
jgi:hypothetical protein